MSEKQAHAETLRRAVQAAREVARNQGEVVSRRQLYRLGVTRGLIRSQVRAGRWQKIGDQSVALHNGSISDVGHRWAAVFQGGPRAMLDGVSALIAGGLERFDSDRIRVSVPRGARIRRSLVYDIRQTRRWAAADRVEVGIPRSRPAVAAVRAGLWALSDKQAALVLSMTVQQGLAPAEAIGLELLRVRRHRRRAFLHAVVNDLVGGARSLAELDVAAELRRRGLPAPARQSIRRDGRNRYYLDLYWPQWRLVVEVDGIHHTWAQNVVGDALRQNALIMDGDTVLRVPLLGLRLQPDDFFRQIEEALCRNGYAKVG
jgi:very-short-patch-repair endonuclease